MGSEHLKPAFQIRGHLLGVRETLPQVHVVLAQLLVRDDDGFERRLDRVLARHRDSSRDGTNDADHPDDHRENHGHVHHQVDSCRSMMT